jgi:hypothetical protein
MAESWPKKFRVERQTGAGTRQDELPKVYPYYRASHHHKFLIGKLERAHEAGLEADKAAVHAFLLGLETRVLKRYGKNDETTLTDIIQQLGVEGYVQAIREELLDGDVDAGMVAIQGHTRTYRYKLTDILDSKRKFAEEVIRRVRKEIEARR